MEVAGIVVSARVTTTITPKMIVPLVIRVKSSRETLGNSLSKKKKWRL
jgi:hypothetical protein